MSKLFPPTLSILSFAFLISCASKVAVKTAPPPAPPPVVVVEKQETHLPPGQAKKIYGEKSAREFAPGQQKKHGSYPMIVVINTRMKVTISNGRRCYRSENDVVYWEGNDGRYYVDERLVPEHYDKKEYDEWNKNKGKQHDADDDQGNGNGNGKGHGKGKKDKDDDQ